MNNLYALKQWVPAKLFAVFTIVSLILSAFPAFVLTAEATAEHKVDICHWSDDDGGKFVSVPASKTADAQGHAGHQDGKDIIPAFDYPEKGNTPAGSFLGQNLTTEYDGKTGAEWLGEGKCPPPLTGSIFGIKFEDIDGDGRSQGDTEPELSGWTIRLYKIGDPWTLMDEDVTDEFGEYEFVDVPAGEYKVCEVMQDDWVQKFVTSGTDNFSPNAFEEGSKCQTVKINDYGEKNTRNFGNYYEEPVDYCDASQKPGGKSIAQWHEENQFDGSSCFDYEVTQLCGSLDVQFTRNDSTLGFGFNYVIGTEVPVDFEDGMSFPVNFDEDEYGGSVDVTYYVVGAEKDYFVGSSVPNFWDGNGTTVSVDTDCEKEKPVCEIGENLLDNGSFEADEVTGGLWNRFASIAGWMAESLIDKLPAGFELHRGWSGNEAADGEQYAELDAHEDGARDSIKVFQEVDTVPGATYELKWAFAPRHNLDADQNQLSVLVNDSEVATEGPEAGAAPLAQGDWTRNSYTFEADGETTEIGFADAGSPQNDQLGTFLDDAVLCYVRDPEPEEPEICSYEGEVVSTDQGLTNGGSPVDVDRSDVSAVENGVAAYSNFNGKEPSWSTDDFYSLGINGELVYEFTNKIAVNQPGDDIAIWEITGGNSGQSAEKVDVYLSENGVDYELAEQLTGDGSVDIADTTLGFVKFVKLVDQSNGVQGNNGDGFDLDAITIIDGSCDDYATVHTTKIVCEDEADLPNWGTGGPNMTENTAADWVAEHDSCELVRGWEFEWGPKTAPDPGDSTIGPAGGVWNTFTASTMVPASAFAKGNLWMREVLQEGYIPFTHEAEGKKNTDDVTAEFYCHKDVLNYDNYDRIDAPKAGEDYYCVAWNVPEEVPEPYQCEAGLLYLDTETDEPDSIMSLHTVDEADGAASFWGEYEDLKLFPVLAVDADEVVYSIEKSSGDLVTLDDNLGGYSVIGDTDLDLKKPVAMEVAPNGTMYTLTENNDALYSVDTTTGDADKLHDLDLTVAGGDVVFDGNTIVYIKNTGQVYAIDHTTFDETLLGTLSVGSKKITSAATKDGTFYAYTRQDSFHPFTLNPFVEETAKTKTGPFAWGDGSFCPAPPEPEQCELDIYSDTTTLVRETNELAVATYDGNKAWTANIPGATWIWATEQVEYPESDETYTFVETFEVENPTEASITVGHDNYLKLYVNGSLVADRTGVNGFKDFQVQTYDILSYLQAGENTLEYEVTNLAADGSNYRSNPAGALFHLSALGDTDSCDRTTEPEAETIIIDGHKFEDYGEEYGPLEGWIIELHDDEGLVAETTTDDNGYYWFEVPVGDYEVHEVMQQGWEQSFVEQNGSPVDASYCKFDYEPEIELLAARVALNHVPQHEGGDNHCDFYNVYDPGEQTEYCEDDSALNYGEEGSCQYEEEERRSSRSSGTRISAEPTVAGAATSFCPFLEDYMQSSWENDSWEVTKLQMFLNIIMGETLELDGIFGRETDEAVKRFQTKYHSEVIAPWFERGIVPHNDPTGFVYKTTKWKINDIVCPGVEPYPSFEGEDLSSNINED